MKSPIGQGGSEFDFILGVTAGEIGKQGSIVLNNTMLPDSNQLNTSIIPKGSILKNDLSKTLEKLNNASYFEANLNKKLSTSQNLGNGAFNKGNLTISRGIGKGIELFTR